MLSIEFACETLMLLAGGAVLWPRCNALFIADPHFGKDAAFRDLGVPVPAGATARDTQRLTRLFADTGAAHLIILGDFLHNRSSHEQQTIESLRIWREQHHDLRITLVRGNHDRTAGDPPKLLRIECVDEPFAMPPFTLMHDATTVPHARKLFCLGGHIHPAIRLRDGLSFGLRCACFHMQSHCLTLPAFGSFTGTHVIEAARDDRVFAVTDEEAIDVSVFNCTSRDAAQRSRG